MKFMKVVHAANERNDVWDSAVVGVNDDSDEGVATSPHLY